MPAMASSIVVQGLLVDIRLLPFDLQYNKEWPSLIGTLRKLAVNQDIGRRIWVILILELGWRFRPRVICATN